jgi:hypothetical protein
MRSHVICNYQTRQLRQSHKVVSDELLKYQINYNRWACHIVRLRDRAKIMIYTESRNTRCGHT